MTDRDRIAALEEQVAILQNVAIALCGEAFPQAFVHLPEAEHRTASQLAPQHTTAGH